MPIASAGEGLERRQVCRPHRRLCHLRAAQPGGGSEEAQSEPMGTPDVFLPSHLGRRPPTPPDERLRCLRADGPQHPVSSREQQVTARGRSHHVFVRPRTSACSGATGLLGPVGEAHPVSPRCTSLWAPGDCVGPRCSFCSSFSRDSAQGPKIHTVLGVT